MLKKENRQLVPNSPLYNEINNLLSSQQIVKRNKEFYNSTVGKQEEWVVPEKETKPTETLTPQQKEKINFYDNLNNYFKNNIPKDLAEQWEKLNKRPNITQEEYEKLKNNQGSSIEGLPNNWKDQLARLKELESKLEQASKGEMKDPAVLSLLISLLTDENKNLWVHVNDLAKIMEEIVPKAPKPPK